MPIGLALLALAVVELAVAGVFLLTAARTSAWPTQRVAVDRPRLSDSEEGTSWLGTVRLPDGREHTVNLTDGETREVTLLADPRSGRAVEPAHVAGRRRLGLILLAAGSAMLVAAIVLLIIG